MNKRKTFYSILRSLFLGITVLVIAFLVTRNLIYREEEKKDSIRRIRERGYIIALTDKNTLNYHIYRGEPMGYQLELLQSFAESLGVPLKIIASNDISKLLYYLNNNVADLVSLNLPISRDGKKLVHFSTPFGETRLVIVQRTLSEHKRENVSRYKRKVTDFTQSDTVYAPGNPFFSSLYHLFYKESGKQVTLIEDPAASQEELIIKVAKGEVDYVLCPENLAMVYRRFYRNIEVSLVVSPLFSYAWGVNHNSDSLLMRVDSWLGENMSSKELKKTYINYFGNQRVVSSLRSEYCSITGDRISPYDDEIKEYSKWISWDWRLVASLVYEESNFIPGQISSHNASGLMQLMPETAAKFGVDSSSSAAQQIAAGVKYLKYLNKQLQEEITNPRERIYFILAAYNVGIGRILMARDKAEEFGKDRNRWNGHVDYYLLNRSKKDPLAKRDSLDSFQIDYKTEGFVDDIVNRYYHYKNIFPE